ncbi:MAG: hypothetical protein SFY70_03855 [Bacteroidia bacterium]|nr:hypothetical protein [Bacteroidia bacterium]
MKWFLTLALGLAFQLAQAQHVYNYVYVKTLPGRQAQYLRFIQANWAPARQALTATGDVVSSQVLVNPDSTQFWDVLLITVYPNPTIFAKREEIFRAYFSTQNGGPVLPDGLKPRELGVVLREENLTEPQPN